jgi:hypothetical protein
VSRAPEEARRSPAEDALDVRAVRRLIARLHDVLRDNDSQSHLITRFDELTKLLFTKVMADRAGPSGAPRTLFEERGTVDVPAIRTYYGELAIRHADLIPPRFRTLDGSDGAIAACVSALRGFPVDWKRFDVAGMAYQEILRKTFDKGDHQQFFTPPHIVDFVVSLAEPFLRGDICDPASGTGGFLVRVARAENVAYRSLTGIEIDERLSWVTGIHLLLHGARSIRSEYLPHGGTLGPDARRFFGRFDAILTNPPFGSDLSDPEVLESMELGRGRSSRRRGILFLERCHALLRDGGTLAMILDEGVLNLNSTTDVRHFVTSRFDVLAIVSLPATAFMPYANVNASVLLLRKRAGTDASGRVFFAQRRAAHDPAGGAGGIDGTSRVFFARAETVGRKPNGDDDVLYRPDGTSELQSDLPAILAAFREHLAGKAIAPSERCYVADVAANRSADSHAGHRLDVSFHDPRRRAVRDRLARCAYPLERLGELCVERTSSVVPATDLADALIRYTGLAHIEARTGVAVQVLTPASAIRSAVKAYEPGDIVFAKMRPSLRKVAHMAFEEGGYVSAECAVYTVRRGSDGLPIVDPLILSVLLRSDFVYDQIVHWVRGIGRPRIGSKELGQVLVPIPPPEVQAEIRRAWQESRERTNRLEREARRLLEEARQLTERAVTELAEAFARPRTP